MEALQLIVSGISQGCVYGLIALGFVLIYKATEMVNFAQGDLMMLGGFVGITFIGLWDWPYLWGFLATLVVLAAFGVLLERFVLRPMIGEPHFAVLMLTIGLGFVLRAVAGAVWGNQPRTLQTPFSGEVLDLGGVVVGYDNLAIIGGTVLLCTLLYVFFRFTRLGIAMQAASQNQLAAFYVGIPVKRIFSLVWALAAAIAAAAGILTAPVSLVDPLMGFVGIKAFAAAIVGGFGSLPGALLGGLLVGVVEQFAGLYLPPGFSDMSAYLLLLVMLFVRPEGLFATMQRKKSLMRFLRKTHYAQDLVLFEHAGQVFWYSLLAVLLLSAPLWLDRFLVGELTQVFIYAIAGIGLMLLVGYTGLVSLGHAAFLAIGAYTHTYLLNIGVPWLAALLCATLFSALIGGLVGIPALRMTGIYLAVATLAFAVIVEQVLAHWESVTGGFRGMAVPRAEFLGVHLSASNPFYFVCLGALVLCLWLALNLLRSPTGRAMTAVRDSEVSAQSMGIHLARTKTLAFAFSAAFTGFAGALFAHRIGYLAPDGFTLILSIQLLLMVVVGGLGSLHGVIFGAAFIGLLPQAIAILRDNVPSSVAQIPGLEPGIFGLILVLFLIFEPDGLYGRWRKVRLYFEEFPLYRRATYKRQKSFLRTERLR